MPGVERMHKVIARLLPYSEMPRTDDEAALEHYDWCKRHRLKVVDGLPRAPTRIRVELPGRGDFARCLSWIRHALGTRSRFKIALAKHFKTVRQRQDGLRNYFQTSADDVAQELAAWEAYEEGERVRTKQGISEVARQLVKANGRDKTRALQAERERLYRTYVTLDVPRSTKLRVMRLKRKELAEEYLARVKNWRRTAEGEVCEFRPPRIRAHEYVAAYERFVAAQTHVAKISTLARRRLTFRALARAIVTMLTVIRIVRLPKQLRPALTLHPHSRTAALLFSTMPKSSGVGLPMSEMILRVKRPSLAACVPTMVYGEELVLQEGNAAAAAAIVSDLRRYHAEHRCRNDVRDSMISHLVVEAGGHLLDQSGRRGLQEELQVLPFGHSGRSSARNARKLAVSRQVFGALAGTIEIRLGNTDALAAATVALAAVGARAAVAAARARRRWGDRLLARFEGEAYVITAAAVAARAAGLACQPLARRMRQRALIRDASAAAAARPRQKQPRSPRELQPRAEEARWRLPSSPAPLLQPQTQTQTQPQPPHPPPRVAETPPPQALEEFDSFLFGVSSAPLAMHEDAAAAATAPFALKPPPPPAPPPQSPGLLRRPQPQQRAASPQPPPPPPEPQKDGTFWYWWHLGGAMRGGGGRSSGGATAGTQPQPVPLGPPPAAAACGALASFIPHVPASVALAGGATGRVHGRHCHLSSSRAAGAKRAGKWTRAERLHWVEHTFARPLARSSSSPKT